MTPSHRHLLAVLWGVGVLLACDRDPQEFRILAQDHRFVPRVLHFPAGQPIRLALINEGREPHEFTSRLLTDQGVRVFADQTPSAPKSREALRIMPGRTVKVTVQAPPGLYLFRCRIRGHTGMRGTIIVE